MTTTLDDILATLANVKRSGSGWSARCPSHDDRNNSLSIAEAADGKRLIHCHTGCSLDQIASSVGLSVSELLGHSANGRPASAGATTSPNGKTSPTPRPASADPLAWWSQYCGVPLSFVKSLPIEADGSRLAFLFPGQPVRKLRTAGAKNFSWDPPGSSTPPLWPVAPAKLPERIWLCEGESDCTVLRFCGLDAYALTHGAAGTLKPTEVEALKRRGVKECVIVFDADQAGREGAAKLARVLTDAGVPSHVLDLAGAGLVDPLAGTKDVRDIWLAFADPEGLRACLTLLFETSPATSDVETEADDGPAQPTWPDPIAEAAFYGLAGEVVRSLAPQTEADPVALLASFLTAFGTCLGSAAYCQVGADRHPFKVWPVLVGATAKGRKGSSWAPIRELIDRADPLFAAERIASGLSSGEGVIWSVRDPITGRERVKDGTGVRYVEVETDPGVTDKRLLVIEEEFSSPLRILAREGNTLSPVLRQAWDRGDLRILTKTSPAKATGAHIGVLGHAVAEEVRRYLAESEMAGGFGNRFLWLCVRRSQCLPRGATLDHARLAELAERVRRALETGRTLGRIDWSDDAGRQWDTIYPELSEGKPGLVGSIIARMEAQALRLAGLYAVLDGSRWIEIPHLHAALAIVDYAEASARWLFGDASGDPVADAILEALRESGEMSRNDIVNLFDRNVAGDRIRHALETLQAAGLATVEKVETGGRPREVWKPCRT